MNSEFAQNSDNRAALSSGYIEVFCVFEDTRLKQVLSKSHFEAISDGDLPLKESQGKVPIVYVIANQYQLIQAAVMFYLPLDGNGYVLDGWRLPLQRLADTAGRGPNLGGGRIRLACRSQCSISWHKDALWDPTTSTFVAVKKAILDGWEAELDKVANVSETGFEGSVDEDEDIDVLRRTLRNETAAYRNQLQSLQQEIERQRLLNERLHRKIETDHHEEDSHSGLDLTALRQQNEQLKTRVKELEVLGESALSDAGKDSSSENEMAAHDLLDKMAEADMLSVVFHPGAGHINLSPAQLITYIEDPIAYVAQQVSLSKAQYLMWLTHHESGKCKVCDVPVSVIGNPRIFNPEVDMYCDEHKPQ